MSLAKNKWFVVSAGSAPIYSGANFNSQCLTEAVRGESCEILGSKRNWFNIKCEDNYVGWVNKFYGIKSNLKNKPNYIIVFPNELGHFNPEFPFGAKVNHHLTGSIKIGQNIEYKNIINILDNLIGIPYKWGGKTSLGFDCSGLVQSVLNIFGFKIPRDCHEQLKFFQFHKIELLDSKLGDLHFFGKGEKVTHVGFSTGRAGIIHSQGYVKNESLDKTSPLFNKNLLDIYICSISVLSKFGL